MKRSGIQSAANVIRRALTLCVACSSVAGSSARAQGYYNLDAGRPTRVEDALPTPRYELDVQFPSLRVESLSSGLRRWRIEPKMTYGIAPFTDVEVRAPFIVVASPDSNTPNKSGFGGLAVGAMHAFGVERGTWPAVAIAGEWIAPVGTLAAQIGSYSIKGVATKTFEHARVHANVVYGTYSTRVSICSLPRAINAPTPPGCTAFAVPFDPPCDVIPDTHEPSMIAARTMPLCKSLTGSHATNAEESFDPTRSVGMRWMTGLGADHAFALASTLFSADVVAERFAGLFAQTDMSAEIGLRHQWSPRIVLDLGVARHFAGPLQSNSVTIGVSTGIATPWFLSRRLAEP